MWPYAGVYDLFSQCWPYAALGALVVVPVLLWKTWTRVRRIEGKVSRLRADLFEIQRNESRRRFEEIKSASVAVIEPNGSSYDLSTIPTTNSGQNLDVQIVAESRRLLAEMNLAPIAVIETNGSSPDLSNGKLRPAPQRFSGC